MGAYYHALFCRYGWEENANEVRDLYNAGKRKEVNLPTGAPFELAEQLLKTMMP
jgi:hypothetical protein